MFLIGKKKLRINLPDGWHEVPFWKAKKIIEENITDRVKLMSLLSDVSEDDIKKSTDIENIYCLMGTLQFLYNQNPVPKKYSLDIDMGKLSVGKVEDMIAVAAKEKDNPLDLAILLYSIFKTDPYDYDQAINDIKKYSDETDYKTVMIHMDFFLQKLNVLVSGLTTKPTRTGTVRLKLMRVLKNLSKRLVFT